MNVYTWLRWFFASDQDHVVVIQVRAATLNEARQKALEVLKGMNKRRGSASEWEGFKVDVGLLQPDMVIEQNDTATYQSWW